MEDCGLWSAILGCVLSRHDTSYIPKSNLHPPTRMLNNIGLCTWKDPKGDIKRDLEKNLATHFVRLCPVAHNTLFLQEKSKNRSFSRHSLARQNLILNKWGSFFDQIDNGNLYNRQSLF